MFVLAYDTKGCMRDLHFNAAYDQIITLTLQHIASVSFLHNKYDNMCVINRHSDCTVFKVSIYAILRLRPNEQQNRRLRFEFPEERVLIKQCFNVPP